MKRQVVAAIGSVLLWACQPGLGSSDAPPPVPATENAGRSLAERGDDRGTQRAELEHCRGKIARVLADTGLPGAPRLEQKRVQLMGRAKVTPVLFLREPSWPEPEHPLARHIKLELQRNPSARTLGSVYHMIYKKPSLARAVFLREGYLYTDEPYLAFALLQKVELGHLFDAERIVIERGSQRFLADRKGDDYVYATGPSVGERAKVLLFDRVWSENKEPGPALHVDLEALTLALGFWRSRLEHATHNALVLNLGYGSEWVMTLVRRQGAQLVLDCELIEPEQRQFIFAARQQELEHQHLLKSQRRAILSMVQEALPFDEPRTEEGQQDGKLRPEWRGAYRRGQRYYEFNGDRYPVFDHKGRPRVPQVCIDFITDTLERASGTWWLPDGGDRMLARGKLSFRAFGIDNQRSVERFTDFAWQQPDKFDVYILPDAERVPLRKGDAFYTALAEHAARYRTGDIVNILGLKDDEKYHYHSLFVYKSDPVTGMPIWLASNAGRPRLRSWYGEMLSAPRRSLKSRIRPRLWWLKSMLDGGKPLANEPVQLQESSG